MRGVDAPFAPGPVRQTHNRPVGRVLESVSGRYEDREFSLTDCSSFVIMRREKLRQAFGFDHNFEQMGFLLWPEPE